MKYLYITILSFVSISLSAQQINKAVQEDVLIKGATLVTVTNGNQQADLLVKDGKIAQIGANLSASGARTIDATGQFVYPGFIDGGTKLGLVEVSAVVLTDDSRELGDIRPQMEALTAVNPNSVAIPVTRTNGVTTVVTVPQGGVFAGSAALINLVGYTPEQMYAGFKAVAMNFPRSGKAGWWDNRSDEDIKKSYDKSMKKINDFWSDSKKYARLDSIHAAGGEKPAYNPAMVAMLPVLKGEKTLFVEVNAENDILEAIEWIKKMGVDAVLTGVTEGWRVADKIAASGIPVIVGPVIAVPTRQYDRYDKRYALPALLAKAGVKVALRTNGTENVRNLPFHAGFAAAYGMTKEEAVKAITIVPAQIFGVDDQYGSLEEGKVANLFICNGDPFEMKTRISHLSINGKTVPLENRQTYLYEEFLDRDGGAK